MSEKKSKYILACDIGGTHITSAIISCDNWSILPETITRTNVNSLEKAKSIFLTWADTIKHSLALYPYTIEQIGIAMPGPFDYEHGIALMRGQNKYDDLYGLNITQGLYNALGSTSFDIRYINDAAAFLQGEVFALGRDQEMRILGITLGTGLGSAVWNRGQKAYDADLWNIPYKAAIFEEYLVTRWFTKRFQEITKSTEPGLKEIIEHHQHTAAFQHLMSEYRGHLFQFLTYFSEKHQCKTYIIGGNIAKAWDIIDRGDLFTDFDICTGLYQENAALIGAASQFE